MGMLKKLKFWKNRNVKENKATLVLKKQLEEERRQIYEEERWILQKWMGAKEELEQVKAELQKLRRDYEQQVRAAERLKNEQREDRRKHVNQVEGLLEDLCKAYTELEEIKAKQSAPNSQPAANAIEPQGHQVVAKQNLARCEGVHEGKTSVDDFTFLRVLGEGAFGKVLLAQPKPPSRPHCKEEFYAIKVLKKENAVVNSVMAEQRILKLVKGHPFIINLHCCFQTEAHLFFVMELAQGGDLRSLLVENTRFIEPAATFYAAEIALALQFLHKQGIVHRDLKPENILLDKEGHIKVTDFGLSKSELSEGNCTNSICGTRLYVAPEMAQGLDYKHDVDWWALGIMIYEMLLGDVPFDSLQSIVLDDIWYPKSLSQEAMSILEGFLDKDPSRRLVNHDKIKSHSFFKSVNWKELEKKQVQPPIQPKCVNTHNLHAFITPVPVGGKDQTHNLHAFITPVPVGGKDQAKLENFSFCEWDSTSRKQNNGLEREREMDRTETEHHHQRGQFL